MESWIIVLLLGTAINTHCFQLDEQMLPKTFDRFLKRYVLHQNFHHIRIFNEYGDTSTGSWSRWIIRWLRGSTLRSKVYVGVVPPLNISEGHFDAMDGSLASLLNESKTSIFYPLYIVPLWSSGHLEAMEKIMSYNEFHKRSWLLICQQDFLDDLRRLYFPLDNMVVLAVLHINNITASPSSLSIDLWDVYQSAPHLPQRYQHLSRWPSASRRRRKKRSSRKTSPLSFSREPWVRRDDLQGLSIRCVGVEWNTYVYKGLEINNSLQVSGIHGDIWQLIQKRLNFTSECKKSVDGEWGSLNGLNYTGAIGQLHRGEADIGIGPFSLTHSRALVVDYPYILTTYGYSIVLKRESRSDNTWTNYTRIFNITTWAVIFVWLVLMTLCIFFVSHFYPALQRLSLTDAVLVTVGALCNRGIVVEMDSLPMRIAFITIYGANVIFYCFYTSFLTSIWTVEKPTVPFTNLQELYDARGTYTFGVVSGTAGSEQFRYSRIALYRSIWTDMILRHPENQGDEETQYRRVSEGGHAALSVSTKMEDEKCKGYTHLPKLYFHSKASWPIRRNSHLFPVFHYQLRNMIEGGIYDRLHMKWKSTLPQCFTDHFQPISFIHVMSIIIALFIGVILSLLILAGECQAKKVVSRK